MIFYESVINVSFFVNNKIAQKSSPAKISIRAIIPQGADGDILDYSVTYYAV